MVNGKRTIVKRLRFTATQANELEKLLETENMIFTDFIRFLIARELSEKKNTQLMEDKVEAETENEDVKKKHRRTAKYMQPYMPKVDPEILRELGRIGNNINQIAKSLNRLCLSKNADIEKFSFGICLKILSEIQQELHQHLEPLPPIFRSDEAVERIKQRARARVLTGRDE